MGQDLRRVLAVPGTRSSRGPAGWPAAPSGHTRTRTLDHWPLLETKLVFSSCVCVQNPCSYRPAVGSPTVVTTPSRCPQTHAAHHLESCSV